MPRWTRSLEGCRRRTDYVMDATVATVGLLDLPEFWHGLLSALIGVAFWFVGLAVLYLIYERYLKDKDRPPVERDR